MPRTEARESHARHRERQKQPFSRKEKKKPSSMWSCELFALPGLTLARLCPVASPPVMDSHWPGSGTAWLYQLFAEHGFAEGKISGAGTYDNTSKPGSPALTIYRCRACLLFAATIQWSLPSRVDGRAAQQIVKAAGQLSMHQTPIRAQHRTGPRGNFDSHCLLLHQFPVMRA